MQRITTATKAVDLFGAGKHGFKDGNLAIGISPTDLDAGWFNRVQEEILSIVEGMGLVADGAALGQMLLAIKMLIQNSGPNIGATSGTADAIIGTFSPVPATLVSGAPLMVRAANPNATPTPTFTPSAGVITPRTIVKGNNLALVPGDISGPAHWLELQYDVTLDKYVLQNPATGVSPTAKASQAQVNARTDDTAFVTSAKLGNGAGYSLASPGYFKLASWNGSFIVNVGSVPAPSAENTDVSVTYAMAFGTATIGVVVVDSATTANNAVVWAVNNTNLGSFTTHWARSGLTLAGTNRNGFFIAIGY